MSITHHHMCAVLNSEARTRPAGGLRILDVGCGNGRLIAQVQARLPQLQPGRSVEVHGFDVSDSDIQREGFFDEALTFLSDQRPDVDWASRLTRITTQDRWPYPDGRFDVVMSNQVIEHVHDHDFVFREIARVLVPGGFSVHIFPLQQSIMEWHVNVPFAHWTSDREATARRIRAWNGFGVGKYRKHKASDPQLTLDAYAAASAARLMAETNYASAGSLKKWAMQCGLRCSFRYTGGLYHNRLRTLLGRPVKYTYRSGIWEDVTLPLYSRLASVTMILSKETANS